MAKRFKLRISRVFPSFNSCRSKDVADDPLPPLFHVSSSPFDLHLRAPPTSLRRHVCSAIASIGCGCSSKPRRRRWNPSPPPPPSDFHWRKEEKWHVVARMSAAAADDEEEDSSDAICPELNATARKRHQQQQQRNKNGSRSKSSKKKKNRSRVRISTSSADHSGWFSSDGDGNGDEDRDECDVDDDTETLMSTSRTFSDESGRDFTNPTLRTIQEQKPRKGYSGRRRVKIRRQRKDSEAEKEKEPVPCPSPETPSPARVSLFGRIGAEGKVRDSVAVVKRSKDPYGDFKRSMVEMILEKEMYGVEELEQLLQCFLSLNSRAHHRVIVQAFSEIWDALFFCSDSPRNVNGGFGGGNSKPASAAVPVLSLL